MYGHRAPPTAIQRVAPLHRTDVWGIDRAPCATRHSAIGCRHRVAIDRFHCHLTTARESRPCPTSEMLDAFFQEGWNARDLDRLMSFMAEDCVFESSGGPDVCGTRYQGRDRVREGFARVFAAVPNA